MVRRQELIVFVERCEMTNANSPQKTLASNPTLFESSSFCPNPGTMRVGDCVQLEFVKRAKMLRTILILGLFVPHVLAQSAVDPESSPIEVTGVVSPIDPHEWAGFKAGPGLFMKVRNISGRNILGFAFETTFTNPETGKAMAVREHGAFRPASRGISLPSDASKPNPKPYQVPITSSGMPASYSFAVDLVIFGDGAKWGPAKLEVSQTLLLRLAQEK
jgi:hypothetical protein